MLARVLRRNPRTLRAKMPTALVAVSFLIYAVAALILHQDQKSEFVPERSSIAAAVSNAVYGARLGKVYSGVLAQMLDFSQPLDESLAQAARKELPAGTLLGSTSDGNGIGYIFLASLSMRLLGAHTSSIVLSMLVLMGASAAAFLHRFRDQRAIVVALYFMALTLMLFTPLVWVPAYAANITIGGIRYFSLVALLPAFHLLLECADTRWDAQRASPGFLLIGVQTIILVQAILVRNSAGPAIAAIAAFCLWVLWKNRDNPFVTARALQKAAVMVLVAAGFVGVLMLSMSRDYLRSGRFTETVWHRVFVSLGVSPSWPYAGLRETYDCRRYKPDGLVPGTEDGNGHCIFWAHAQKQHMPFAVAAPMTYGRGYDAALRDAFFDIVRSHPGEAAKTFFYYKPRLVFASIAESLDFKVSAKRPALVAIFVLTLANFILFLWAASPNAVAARYADVGVAAALLSAFTVLPYIVVWAMPHTSADLLLLCIFGLGLAATVASSKIRRVPLARTARRLLRLNRKAPNNEGRDDVHAVAG